MMRLIKLAAYALLGYALYEFVQGMLDESKDSESQKGQSSQRQNSGTESSQPSGQVITGGQAGRTIDVQDAGGAVTHRTVGRGVVS